ncbi:transcriptional regulator [Massilia sp. KIM]|uniref:LysR family transcriptional regulator n=1 Tax=Massilia sp. KIM TaxID=1955422 RepID=UPI00098FB83E|nr:LysR family transcriptional regulator [Massilia sp. KIM]OON63266.1 transcriptional regulator [Massilia sp. KIM]
MDKARVISLFIGVVRAGSFSQAAVAEGLSAQSVSKAIRQLEEHLGLRLFHRTTRSLSLTDEGQRLYELAHPGLRLLDEALEQVRGSRDEVEGLIRVAAPTSLGIHLLAPILRGFQERYPGAHFDLVLADQFTDLVAARIDVGFRAGNPPERNLVARKLADIVLKICAAPDYLERHGAPRDADELLRHRCTGYRQANTGRLMPWELKGDGGTVYLDVPCVASFNTTESEVAAVRNGLGIGQLAHYMVDEDLAAGRLVHLLPRLDTRNAAIYMYYAQRTRIASRVRLFIDYAFEAARRQLGGA